MEIQQAVILAGGQGTRLRPFSDTAPKAMYPFEGKPFLERLIQQIKGFGITDILLLLGYLPEKIMDYFGDGSSLGVHIQYQVTPVEYETGTRLKAARKLLAERILLLYCDNYCPLQWDKLTAQYKKSGLPLQITAYENKDGYTRDNLRVSPEGVVACYDKRRETPGLSGVDIGYILMHSGLVDRLPEGNVSFEQMIYPALVEKKEMGAYVTPHRYYSVGGWPRIELTETFFQPKKVVFLDRDGTLNRRPPQAEYITKPEDFVWLDGAREAVRLLKEKGYSAYLVTNQPGIARGKLSMETLHAIHEKMQAELKDAGGEIDDIFFCPHGWDEGCDCRKPRPGMLYQAQKKYSLDLTKCCLIGDDERDISAGEAAGCRCFLVDETHSLLSLVKQLP